ncbi:sigma-70 family RNA polymerase sigma factor [bacterium BMS3Abin03]|nr:sigma-70 family RNA polymerase sigma factor [bacterium BMS3Abin03]MCG6960923.1 sigma-70 family RNA polymerase sigma factor [bacterium BMS3Abin03]
MLESSKFDYLIQRYKNKIFNYAIYMMHNQMDAEDITQEVMIRTWQNIDKFNFYAASAWMMRTTHNLCIDYLRRNKVQFQREISIDDNLSERIEDKKHGIMPEKKLSQNMLNEKIKSAVENLPERLKSPFVLYELQGFKYKEISKILDIPLNSVKVNILRARKQLQKDLKVYANEELN